MAVDKRIDSVQLDSDLTSIANAIRAKGGQTGEIVFPSGFISEIQAIPSGGGATKMLGEYRITSAGVVNGIDSSGEIKIQNFSAGSGIASSAITTETNNAVFSIDLSGEYAGLGSGAFNTNTKTGAIKKITAKDDPNFYLLLTSLNQTFRSAGKLTEITAKVLISSTLTSSDRTFNSCTDLEYINFAPNCCQAPLSFGSSSKLTDAGLVAIANCLMAGSATLTLHATPKARCSTLMGTVSQVTESGVTYDFFTADANGTVSLQSFITTTKGWTLA